MADVELAAKLSKRSQIIDEDERRNDEKSVNNFFTGRKENDTGVLKTDEEKTNDGQDVPHWSDEVPFLAKPTIPPKPKLSLPKLINTIATENPEPVQNGSNTNIEKLDARTERNKKPTVPAKPPRASSKSSTNFIEEVSPSPTGNAIKSQENVIESPTTPLKSSAMPQTILDERNDEELKWTPVFRVWNPYTEFKEFSRKDIQRYQKAFQKYDYNKDKFLDSEELKYMMEKIGHPQTHLALKAMIKEVDEDNDNQISFREFMLIFRKAQNEELSVDSGLFELYRYINEIDVEREGISGAKNFFEAKILNLTRSGEFENEIKQEKLEQRLAADERSRKKLAFKETIKIFENI